MKKLFLVVLLMIFVMGCSSTSKTNTTSFVKILEKGTTANQYWVVAIDPNAHQKKEFKITVDSENTWNLIEKNQEYFATYEYTSLDKRVDLLNIKRPSKPNE